MIDLDVITPPEAKQAFADLQTKVLTLEAAILGLETKNLALQAETLRVQTLLKFKDEQLRLAQPPDLGA